MKINWSDIRFHNYLSGSLLKLTIMTTQLVVIPLFIKFQGVEKYGEWLILTTIPNYLMLSDLGLNQTITNEICKLLVKGKYIKQKNIFISTFNFLLLLGFFLFVFYLFFIHTFDLRDLLGFNNLNSNQIELILGSYVLSVVMFLILRLLLGYFKAVNKFYMHEYSLFLTYVFDFIVTLFVLSFYLPLWSIPFGMFIVRIIIFISAHFYLKRLLIHYKLAISTNFNYAIKMLPVSIRLSLFSLGYAILLQGGTFIVGLTLGSIYVVSFNTIRTLINSLKAFVAVLYLPTMPEFAVLFAKNNVRLAFLKYKKLLQNVALISLFACFFIYFLKDILFYIWLGTELKYPNGFVLLMLISIFIQILWNASSMLPLAINNLKILSFFPLFALILLSVEYFIIQYFGLLGLAFGFIFLDLLMFFLVTNQSLTLLRENNNNNL